MLFTKNRNEGLMRDRIDEEKEEIIFQCFLNLRGDREAELSY